MDRLSRRTSRGGESGRLPWEFERTVGFMSDVEGFADEPGERFETGAHFTFQDAMQRRLRYHLLRLTVVGLSQNDVELLSELARLASQEADITEHVTAIREGPGASPLASAIAAVVERAGPGGDGRAGRADVMVGAVVGAYAGLRDTGGSDRTASAVLGAIGGGLAASIGPFIRERIAEVGADEYLRMDERS